MVQGKQATNIGVRPTSAGGEQIANSSSGSSRLRCAEWPGLVRCLYHEHHLPSLDTRGIYLRELGELNSPYNGCYRGKIKVILPGVARIMKSSIVDNVSCRA